MLLLYINAYRIVSYIGLFEGMNHSGIGRENVMEATYQHLETKSVFIKGKSKIKG